MGRGNGAEEILYGQVGPRSFSEDRLLSELYAEIRKHAQDGGLHGLSSVPEDFFPFLAIEAASIDADVPDPRIGQMIRHVGEWICSDSVTADTVQAAYQLLAYAPAIAYGTQADGSRLDDTYQRLLQKCLAYKMAYVNPEREALDNRIMELMQARDLKPKVLPRLTAKSEKTHLGPTHYMDKSGKMTACGCEIRFTGNQGADGWVSDIARSDPAALSASDGEAGDPTCRRCAGKDIAEVGTAPLAFDEQSSHLSRAIDTEVPRKMLTEFARREPSHPLGIQKMIEKEIWSVAVRSLLLEEPLSDHDLDYLAELEPGDVII